MTKKAHEGNLDLRCSSSQENTLRSAAALGGAAAMGFAVPGKDDD
jgi:uncharacterized protein (DUF1778 family)